MTMMKSPVSTCGVNSGLCLPRSRCATSLATRPRTLSVASITYQSRFTSWGFAEKVFMIFPNIESVPEWTRIAPRTCVQTAHERIVLRTPAQPHARSSPARLPACWCGLSGFLFRGQSGKDFDCTPRRPLDTRKRGARVEWTKKTQAIKLGFESTKGGGWRRHLLIVDLVGCTASADPMVRIIPISGACARQFALRNLIS